MDVPRYDLLEEPQIDDLEEPQIDEVMTKDALKICIDAGHAGQKPRAVGRQPFEQQERFDLGLIFFPEGGHFEQPLARL